MIIMIRVRLFLAADNFLTSLPTFDDRLYHSTVLLATHYPGPFCSVFNHHPLNI